MELSIRTRLTLWYTAILLSILVVISGLSYSLLRSRLMQDLDASLLAVGLVVRDTGWSGSGAALGLGPESALREILGPEFYDKFFQLVDPEGRLGARSTHLREETLPLSAQARENAAHGAPPGGRHVPHGTPDQRRGPRGAASAARNGRRAGPPGRDAQRDAGAARGGLRSDASLHGRRRARAAHAADRAQGHDRGCAA